VDFPENQVKTKNEEFAAGYAKSNDKVKSAQQV